MPGFDFGNADHDQREVIAHTEGPLLVTAGPGAGKTSTLVRRVAYLVTERGVRPDQILVTTFTEKAASELMSRCADDLRHRGVRANPADMYIGTFHSLCLRIIKDHMEYSHLPKNFTTLDGMAQSYLIFSNISSFRGIEGYDELFRRKDRKGQTKRDARAEANNISRAVSKVAEECLQVEGLLASDSPEERTIGQVCRTYAKLLDERGHLDFARMQTECLRMLEEEPAVLEAVRAQFLYTMVDEYQDTNRIQERLAMLISGGRNICVVGDDDQSIYRFRGATVQNILEFQDRVKAVSGMDCAVVKLGTNYRSTPSIVNFCERWIMSNGVEWGRCRLDKELRPSRQALASPSPAVVKVEGNAEVFSARIAGLVQTLLDGGKISDPNQVALLSYSVKDLKVRDKKGKDSEDGRYLSKLAEELGRRGIDAYVPRASRFFDQDEVRLAIGCLLLMFPAQWAEHYDDLGTFQAKFRDYCEDCQTFAESESRKPGHGALRDLVYRTSQVTRAMPRTTDLNFTRLLYQLYACAPFASMLATEADAGVRDQREVRNLSILTNLVNDHEIRHNLQVLTADNVSDQFKELISFYLPFVYQQRLDEYEDETESVPRGCMSFMTIHQSKGMEFPVVVVNVTDASARSWTSDLEEALDAIVEARDRREGRARLEDKSNIDLYDFLRRYYVAFSRAETLLVLAVDTGLRGAVSDEFRDVLEALPDLDTDALISDERLSFQPVSPADIKPTFAFTSDVSFYDACPQQYKLYREYGFPTRRGAAALFGSLVHQSIEDVHRAVMRGEAAKVAEGSVARWVHANYESLSKARNGRLDPRRLEEAVRQVQRYVGLNSGRWDLIREAEVPVTLPGDDYTIDGTIDLVRGRGDTVELVDFKSERKPADPEHDERVQHYRDQLQLYAHLVEETTGHRVSRLHLYYTADQSDQPDLVFDKDDRAVDATVAHFDDIARKIIACDFEHPARDRKTCGTCDFKGYCEARGLLDKEEPATERPAKPRQPSGALPAPLCPNCGAPMVLRTAGWGKHKGEQFWGCSNYRKTGCRGIRGI